jgi:hypothetical protein
MLDFADTDWGENEKLKVEQKCIAGWPLWCTLMQVFFFCLFHMTRGCPRFLLLGLYFFLTDTLRTLSGSYTSHQGCSRREVFKITSALRTMVACQSFERLEEDTARAPNRTVVEIRLQNDHFCHHRKKRTRTPSRRGHHNGSKRTPAIEPGLLRFRNSKTEQRTNTAGAVFAPFKWTS